MLEGRQVALGLAVQPHHGKHRNLEPQFARVDIGMIAADVTHFLKRAHTAQTGGRGNADAARQLDIGHPTVRLQFCQNLAVDLV